MLSPRRASSEQTAYSPATPRQNFDCCVVFMFGDSFVAWSLKPFDCRRTVFCWKRMPILPRLLKPLKQKRKGRGCGIAGGGGEAELGEKGLGNGQVEGDDRGVGRRSQAAAGGVARCRVPCRLASCVLRLGAFDLGPGAFDLGFAARGTRLLHRFAPFPAAARPWAGRGEVPPARRALAAAVSRRMAARDSGVSSTSIVASVRSMRM